MQKQSHRTFFSNAISIIGAGIVISSLTNCSLNKDQSPNIVLFLSDDHGRWFTDCYGNESVRTPNMDKLASQGCQFNNAFCASPTCMPSRTSIYTGQYPNNHGAHENHSKAYDDVKSLPLYLKDLGYTCILAGKQHIEPMKAFPFAIVPETASYWSKEHIYLVEEANNVANTISSLTRRQPFCIIIATHNSHSPHPEIEKPYDPTTIDLPPYIPDNIKERKKLARYYDAVTALDDELGIVMKKLEEQNLVDNTLFIYTADQGQDAPRAKYNLYDQGINVPFIVRWPGVIKEGSKSDAMISHIDLMPTFLDIAGGTAPNMDGKTLLPLFYGKTSEHRDLIFTTHTKDPIPGNLYPMRSVRSKQYKYILNLAYKYPHTAHGITDYRPEEELYDIQKDPYELNNLALSEEHKDIKTKMNEYLISWMNENNDPGDTIPESVFIEKLARINAKKKK